MSSWTKTLKKLGLKSSSTKTVSAITNTVVETDTNIYIPATTIHFTVSMLKPNTVLYGFFDGKAISNYIQPTGKNLGDELITDNSGYAEGEFHLPNNSTIKFISGVREFKLCDSNTNTDYTTVATATYTYTGTADNIDSTEQSIDVYEGYGEPIIQSFLVNERGGAFISRIGLFFMTKDETQPILLQIREVLNNGISSTCITDSSVVINSSEVKISSDPLATSDNVITWINFRHPIYLSEGKEYAIYMISNSNKYTLHAVDYGTLNNNQVAEKAMSVKSLIQNQAGSELSRDNSRGLKLLIDKCQFPVNTTYQLQLVNESTPTKILSNNALFIKGKKSPEDTDPAIIRVTDPTHSFNVGSLVNISGVKDGTYAGLNASQINGLHEITDVTWNTYSFNNYYEGNRQVIYSPADEDLVFGIGITTDQDYQYDNFYLNTNAMVLTGTNVKYDYMGISGKSIDGNEQSYSQDISTIDIVPNILITNDRVKKIASDNNAEHFSTLNGKSAHISISLSTTNENLSPVLDTNNNLILVENLINDSYESENTDDGKACARYISKTISLVDPAVGLKVQFLGAIQPTTSIHVYYKTLKIDNVGGTIDSEEWVEMVLDRDVLLSNNDTDFKNYSYSLNDLAEFRAFKIKIVMNSTNSCKVPLIRNLAAVAFSAQ